MKANPKTTKSLMIKDLMTIAGVDYYDSGFSKESKYLFEKIIAYHTKNFDLTEKDISELAPKAYEEEAVSVVTHDDGDYKKYSLTAEEAIHHAKTVTILLPTGYVNFKKSHTKDGKACKGWDGVSDRCECGAFKVSWKPFFCKLNNGYRAYLRIIG